MEKMHIKKFFEESFKQRPVEAMHLATKLIELEAIENWVRVMYGVELEINVVPAEVPEGRFYGKSLADYIRK